MTARPGVTLVELIVALAIFSVLLATTLAFYKRQGDAFTEGNDRMAVMQNLRYGVNTVEQNLRTAGIGVPSKQPVIVYADDNVVAFNADYATNLANDFFAVFYDHRLPDAAVSAVTPTRAFTIPLSSFTYPDSAYYQGSSNSPAETITLYFEPDTSTTRTDDYVLYRKVNDLEADVVARRLLATDRPFFTYYRISTGGTGDPIVALSGADLPAAHSAPVHGSLADTGAAALVDSIRAVRVTYAATNGMTGSQENMREITRLIRLPNAGVETQPNCGSRPLLGTSLTATGVDGTATEPGYIRLEWTRATDEYTGEQDVLRYVIWRRKGSSGPWGDPLVSVSPGSSSYVYEDHTAVENQGYTYALAAQDCTPQYSALATAGPVDWDQD
ncbi:MAG: prepilin-type N-terminal cleavage/methylation domain-containing protein [Longimicrobiales bacterium]